MVDACRLFKLMISFSACYDDYNILDHHSVFDNLLLTVVDESMFLLWHVEHKFLNKGKLYLIL